MAKTADHAFTAKRLTGAASDPTFAGALSFMRRKFSKDVEGRGRGGVGHSAATRR